MYPHQQGGSSSYDYSSYSASPYEQQAPPAQAAGRAVRSGTSQTHSPQHQPDYPSSSSYASSAAYSTAPYNISSSHTQQWQPDSWAAQQYAPFASQAMQTEVSYTTATPRTDQPVTVSPPDARSFAPTTMNQAHEPRRQDSGYIPSFPASSHTSSPPRNRRRDKESPMVGPAPTAAPGLDFLKLQDSYRFLLDGTNSLIGNGAFASSRPPPVETIDRMMQSATYGMQMLQSVVAQSNPDMRPMTGGVDKDAPAPKRQKGDEHAQEGQTCLGCNATSTPEWRRGPLGPRTLCNACGLVYAKLLKKRARGEARSRAGDNAGQSSQHTMDETGVASSEDEDSYGSQERRSDFGDHGRRA